MIELLRALFEMITGASKVAEKAIAPDEIRIKNHEIAIPRLEAKEKIRIYDVAFRRLKNHPEIDIATDVAFNYDHLNPDDQSELIEMLNDRVTEYRKNRPILFRKWLKQNNHI